MDSFYFEKEIALNRQFIATVVKNVDDYADFLPWITDSQTYDHIENCFIGRLSFCIKGFEYSYLSRVLIDETDEESIIKAMAIDGPFQSMKSVWSIKERGQNHSFVRFSIDLSWNNPAYRLLFKSIFSDIAEKTIDAFEKRAFEQKEQSKKHDF